MNEPKAAIVSAIVDWKGEAATDIMVTFVNGHNPIEDAHEMIAGFVGRDFPDHEHHVWANDAAQAARSRYFLKGEDHDN
jgi:hypothetical protein